MIGSENTKLGKDFPFPEYLLYTDEGKPTIYGQLENPGWSYLHNYNVAYNMGMVTSRFPIIMNRVLEPVKTPNSKEKFEQAEDLLSDVCQKLIGKYSYADITELAEIVITANYDLFFSFQAKLTMEHKVSESTLQEYDKLFYTMGIFKRQWELKNGESKMVNIVTEIKFHLYDTHGRYED